MKPCTWLAAAAAAVLAAAWATTGSPAQAAAGGAVLPDRLVDTGLYGDPPGEGPHGPDAVGPDVRAFTPQYPLWSDGLVKRRWVHLPPGTAIDATDPLDWQFPVGTRFWKEFSHSGRRVETRLLWRTEAGWLAAAYVWNEAGTEARLAPEEGVFGAVELAPRKRHTIPARADCLACHGSEPAPLGFTALQLSTDRDPNAIHGEPAGAGSVTLRTLADEALLSPPRPDLLADPPRIRTESPTTRAMLGYLSTNCGVCHNGRGEIAALGPTFRIRELLVDGDGVAARLLDHPTKWQRPGAAEGDSVLVHAGAPDLSALFLRMRSRAPSTQMPPLGTVLRDEAALQMVAGWIASHPGGAD